MEAKNELELLVGVIVGGYLVTYWRLLMVLALLDGGDLPQPGVAARAAGTTTSRGAEITAVNPTIVVQRELSEDQGRSLRVSRLCTFRGTKHPKFRVDQYIPKYLHPRCVQNELPFTS